MTSERPGANEKPIDGVPATAAPGPSPEHGRADGASKVCRKCKSENLSDADRCRKCGCLLVGNRSSVKHELYARHKPAEIVMSADQMLDGLVSDKGGADEMTTLQRSLAAKLRDTDILLALNKRTIISEGVDTAPGRKAHDRYLAVLDRFVRIAGLLGLEREAKRVDYARVLSGMR